MPRDLSRHLSVIIPPGPARSKHPSQDGERIFVPEEYRSASVPWAAYDPPEWTDPQTFTTGVRDGSADPEHDPMLVPGWRERQRAALLPYAVVDGRPVNPVERTGRRGRGGLGLWGENAMADAKVTATVNDQRYLLLVKRGDGRGWALPGGSVEAGESPLNAGMRELEEETGLRLPLAHWTVSDPVYVPDPRASDWAWAVTVCVSTHLDRMPVVDGRDDAVAAAWFRAGTVHELVADIVWRYPDGRLFAAHVDLLTRALRS